MPSKLQDLYKAAPGWLQTTLLNAYAVGIRWHRYGRRYRRALEELLAAQYWTPERIRKVQDQRVRQLIRFAYEHTIYYKEVLNEAGLTPTDIRGVDDLQNLPILEKETLRSEGHKLLTRERPALNWTHGSTSGTTGAPLSLWYDRGVSSYTNAVDRRHKIWAGMQEQDWIGLLLGRVIVPPERGEPPYWKVNYIQRQVWFSSFHLSDANLGSYVAEIRRRGLRFLEGYPSTLFILATYLIRHDQVLPMRAVISSSETLHRMQREVIEAAFQCQLFDFYAMAERVAFAGECERHEGKHLAETYGFVEVVDADGKRVEDGEAGFIVGTSLHNYAMPLIRYRLADVSHIVVEQCPCSRSLRRIAAVTTKAEDVVITPDGRWISPSVLTHPFKPLTSIQKSQLIQIRPEEVLVKLVPRERIIRGEIEQLKVGLAERLGPQVAITVEVVNDIPREPSGKYRWIISRINHAAQVDWT